MQEATGQGGIIVALLPEVDDEHHFYRLETVTTERAKGEPSMSSRKLIPIICASAIISGFASLATAQLPDRRTIFTFSGPVAIPGATLPAGRYVFRLAEPGTSARVVQVFSADGKKPYGLFFSHPAERNEPARDPEVRFLETGKGAPAAIKTWWYPGERTGFEFVYPKDQARRLAQGSKQSILTTKAASTTTDQSNTANLSRISPTGEESNVADAAATAPSGTAQQGAVADASLNFAAPAPAESQAPVQTGTNARNTRTGLPGTASNTPMFGLIGLIALAAATALRFWRRGNTPVALR
ncbi:MAG: hypothetical protein ABJA98_13200 [Acidobacteriota bacterium]